MAIRGKWTAIKCKSKSIWFHSEPPVGILPEQKSTKNQTLLLIHSVHGNKQTQKKPSGLFLFITLGNKTSLLLSSAQMCSLLSFCCPSFFFDRLNRPFNSQMLFFCIYLFIYSLASLLLFICTLLFQKSIAAAELQRKLPFLQCTVPLE